MRSFSFGDVENMLFSTKDMDNDAHSSKNCAVNYKGAWWYNACHAANLNGQHLKGSDSSHVDGISWRTLKGSHNSLKLTEMKIRPKAFATCEQ